MIGADNIILAIYNCFKYSLFHEMKRYKLEKCMFYDYYDHSPVYGRFCFRPINTLWDNPTCNISITIDKFGYEYYDKLVDVFKSHADWLFEIGEYDYDTDTFDIRFIVFKKPIYSGVKKECYRISIDGIDTLYNKRDRLIADYIDADARCVYETFYAPLNVNPDFDLTSHLGLPALPTFKFDSPFSDRIPTLSKPPKFMLYTGKYSDLQTMQLHNRQQMELFGIAGGDFVCCRCRNHGNLLNGFSGHYLNRGIFLCYDCLLDNWKDRKKGGD